MTIARAGSSQQIFRGPGAGDRDVPRLQTQFERIRAWALAREWFTIREARESLERIYSPTLFPENSIGAQLRNSEKPEAGEARCRQEKRHAGGGLWEYRLRALSADELRNLAARESNEKENARQIPAGGRAERPVNTSRPRIVWPATAAELKAARFKPGSAKKCDQCGRHCQWFKPSNGKWILLSTLADGRFAPHFTLCGRKPDPLRGEPETICRAELEAYAPAPAAAPARSAQRALF